MTIEEYLDRLEELNIEIAALTDTHNLFGAFKFHQKALARGIKPIIGIDLSVQTRTRDRISPVDTYDRIRVYVEHRQGYRTLCQVLSESYQQRDEAGLLVPLEELASRPDGLLFAGPPGPGPDEVPNYERESIHRSMSEFRDRFGDRFFAEVPIYPSRLNSVEPIVEEAVTQDIPVIVTRPAYFPQPGGERRLRLRKAVQENKRLRKLGDLAPHRSHQYVEEPNKLQQQSRQLEIDLADTYELADRCHFEFETDQFRLPSYPFAEESPHETLSAQCRDALETRSFSASREQAGDRLDRELDVIQSMGFSDYFLIVADVVNWARDQEIRVGPGRGSSAGSFVSYLLGITAVDPFEFDLVFERFLNPQRNEMPDIDIDFSDDRRGEVIEYIRDRYGPESVAHIITFGKMKARNAIRAVVRIRGEDQDSIASLAESIPGSTSDSLTRLRNHHEPFRTKIEADDDTREWFNQARELEGMIRNPSIHAAGILIVEGHLNREIPLYYSDEDDPVPASQYDMYDIENLGYLKLDILGLTTLTIINKTIERIDEQRRPDMSDLPDSDEATLKFLREGSLEGIFQFESAGSRELVRDLNPRSRRDVVDCIALYRPGPMEIRDDYLRRKRDPSRIQYPHEDLKPILEDTYGLILYQEQVMAIARTISGFSWAEADTLRKAMGKKRADLMEHMKQDFVDGAVGNGYERSWAKELFETLSQFAEYGFNRSHSAAYGEITYSTAYLKAHFTAEFYAALLTVKSDNRDRVSRIIQGMREDEIELRAPSINGSGAEFQVEDGAVRFGLRAIKHVGHDLAREVERKRSEEPFTSPEDFTERIEPGLLRTQAFQAIVAAGCFDELIESRGWVVEHADEILQLGKTRFREQAVGQANIFDNGEIDRQSLRESSGSDPWSREQRLRAQKRVLGFIPRQDTIPNPERTLSTLPKFTYPGFVDEYGNLLSEGEWTGSANPQVVGFVGGTVREGDDTLLKIRDEHEEILLKSAVNPVGDVPETSPCLIHLRHSHREWTVTRVDSLSRSDPGLEVHLTGRQDLRQLRTLKTTLEQFPGNTPVRLHVHEQKRFVNLETRIELTDGILDKMEGILGKNCTRLYVVDPAS